ncbi:aminopeptidase N-like [Phymastichus coffea]|uniref:aminopeptidase N-like n=1 Tax=Phymastichus coffea TaxID=108790 RepID=UPI00273CA0E0|nr:aminopeptidase N-like [Phymastichus coffea]
MLCKIISIFFLILLIRAEARPKVDSKSDNEEEGKISYRLPSHVVPKNYTITLRTYFDEDSEKNFTFEGNIEITLEIEQESLEIILHGRELHFEPKDVVLKRNEKTIQTSIIFDKERDFVRIYNINAVSYLPFVKGNYILKINKFRGILSNEMRGFYRSSYKNEKGDTTWLATTHFEPVGARRAFPCFDEPNFKATFNLTIIHPVNYNAISNMPIRSSSNFFNDTLAKTTFYTTPPMSTYLLAFVVSDFKYLENNNFKVHAKSSAVQYGKLALESGEKILKELQTYTGIKFSLPKMDQIAIPDLAAGAMENWGLVTYREKSLLYNEKTSTTSQKQNIVETIAHEFAHQWFGDLVSPKWWKFLWLNEGFANFFQSLITQQVEPKWQSTYQSVVKSIQTLAFDFDSTAKTHPINQEVEKPSEIGAIFDSISYQKAGAIIRMMQHFLGNRVFKRGLHIYLTENGFKTANSSDLFRAFDEALQEIELNLGYKIETIMDAWVNSKGYPVVTVTRNYNDSKEVKIEQKRFFSYNATEENEDITYWHIPINYATTKNQSFHNTSAAIWLNESSKTLPLSAEPDEWIVLNKQQTGFYRVNYDEKNWQLIINHLDSDQRNDIHVLNRAQLINDALAFVKKDDLTLGTLLNLTFHLTNETDYIAWYPGFKSFSWLRKKLANTNHYVFFKEYVLNITQRFVQSVGFEESSEDEHIDKLKRVLAVHWSCLLGNMTCSNYAKTKLEKWIAQTESNLISPDLKQVTVCEGLRIASLDLWHKVFNKCVNSSDDDEKSYLSLALGCSNNGVALQYYLNYTLDHNTKLNDTISIVQKVCDNSNIGVDTVLDFIISRYENLILKYKDEKRLSNLFQNVGEKITTETQLAKLKATKDVDIPANITANGLKAAEKNIIWLEQNNETINDWKETVKKKSANM